MALSATIDSRLAYKIIKQSVTTNTSNNHVTGTTSGSLYSIYISNQANSAVFVKIVDATSATVGTTSPTFFFRVAQSDSLTVHIPGGLAYTSGLSFWAVTNPDDPNSTAPAGGSVAVILTAT